LPSAGLAFRCGIEEAGVVAPSRGIGCAIALRHEAPQARLRLARRLVGALAHSSSLWVVWKLLDLDSALRTVSSHAAERLPFLVVGM
jgi:hypothetical protein